MVDIRSPASVAPVPSAASGGGERRQPAADERPPAPRRPEPRRGVRDVAFVMGIPLDEVTPRVEEALTQIMREFDRIRFELDASRDRVARLERHVDAHPFLEVLSRRALVRQLGLVLERAAAMATENAFVCFHLATADAIRRRHGHAALRVALAASASGLADGLRASDILGSLGGYDFGVVLTLVDADAAAEKAASLAASLAAVRPVWERAELALELAWGVHALGPADTAETAIAAADRDLVGRLAETRR